MVGGTIVVNPIEGDLDLSAGRLIHTAEAEGFTNGAGLSSLHYFLKEHDSLDGISPTKRSTFFRIYKEEDTLRAMWTNGSLKGTKENIPNFIIDYFTSQISNWEENCFIECCTEFSDGFKSWRCHPFFSQGTAHAARRPWYDWTMARFLRDYDQHPWLDGDDTNWGREQSSYPPDNVPAKLLAMWRRITAPTLAGRWMLLLHPCQWRSSNREDTALTESWYLEFNRRRSTRQGQELHPALCSVSPDCCHARVFVMEADPHSTTNLPAQSLRENPDLGRVILVKSREEWPGKFL
jgi:hypothetical protein